MKTQKLFYRVLTVVILSAARPGVGWCVGEGSGSAYWAGAGPTPFTE